jgi:hypothetical protein
MTLLRWKAQSLQFHRHLTGPDSNAARQGILPAFANLAFVIASCGGAIAGMAKKSWIAGSQKELNIDRVRSLRSRINAAFDQLELIILRGDKVPVSAIRPENDDLAAATYDLHGNFAILALAAMEEASELAVPLMAVADGTKTLEKAKPEIDFESADVRINLHIISEKASVCSERSTTEKWMLIRERHPEEAFQPPKLPDLPDGASKKSKRNEHASLSNYLQLL